MGILKDRTDFDFQFTYPGAFTGTASGILVLLDDAIMLEWTPSTLEIQGNYNITMACNDNKDKSSALFLLYYVFLLNRINMKTRFFLQNYHKYLDALCMEVYGRLFK